MAKYVCAMCGTESDTIEECAKCKVPMQEKAENPEGEEEIIHEGVIVEEPGNQENNESESEK